jgi:ferric iron reductase protein FhuF
MELMESRWTDDRMDDLKHQVDVLVKRMEEGFSEQRREMNARFDRLEKRFDKIDARFERVDERFEGVNRRFEKVDAKIDAKFDVLQDQIARTQETVIGLHAMLSRFSLWFAGAMAVTIVSVLLTLWLR